MKDTQFMTAKEKELVLKGWIKFLNNDFKQDLFTKRVYDHLTLHCSFIAHYDLNGFYLRYFRDPYSAMEFFQQFDRDFKYQSIEYGSDGWVHDPDYADINQAMCYEFEKVKGKIIPWLKEVAENHDLTNARDLAAKHGYLLVKKEA